MHRVLDAVMERLRDTLEIYAAYDAVPVDVKGRGQKPYTVLVPERLEWGDAIPSAEGTWYPFTLHVHVSVLLPMKTRASAAAELFASAVTPAMMDAGFVPTVCTKPEVDLKADRFVCSRGYRLNGFWMNKEEVECRSS